MSDIIILGEVMVELAPLQEQGYSLGTAGDTYNTACTLQGLGLDVCYVTALGSGRQADRIRASATTRGLTLAEPAIDPARTPGLYLISTDSTGERSFEYWRSDSAASALFKQPETLQALLEPLQSTPYWYFTGITLALMSGASRQTFAELLGAYRRQGGTVIFDPNYRPALWSSQAEAADAIAHAQAHVDIYLPGFEEQEALFGFNTVNSAAAALLNTGAREVVIKNGAQTCMLIADGAIREIAITPAQSVLDTTGAGDTFNGAYISARLQQFSPGDAIAFAAQAASAVLQVNGGLLKPVQLQRLKTQLQVRQQQQQQQQSIATPRYDRDNTAIGIVHIGPGAFHRAHQAVYTENAMNRSGGNWGICGVSLRSSTARDVLSTQDYLYTLAILDKTIHYQIIGAIKEVLVAGEQSDAIFARLLAATTRIVSLTITEKGYCLNADGSLDMAHPDIAADLSNPRKPQTAVGFIVEGLRLRHASGVAAFNVLSCDNVSGNGDKLRRATLDYALKIDQTLASWIADRVAFPNSMVDSITPKTEDYTISSVSRAIGAQDNWPVQREEFTQWVIDDDWTGDRPDWEGVGVVFTNDVEGFEKAKLRLLNCLHSTLAYSGSLAGFETVYEVSSDAGFHRFLSALASTEIIGSFDAPGALDIEKYSRDVIARFLNPEIHHLLSQIACDGSQKIQIRLLPIIRDNLRLQRPTQYLCLSLASWFEFICRALEAGREITDPMADMFSQLPALRDGDPGTVVKSFLSIKSIFDADLIDNPLIIQQLTASLLALRTSADNGQSIADALNRRIYDD